MTSCLRQGIIRSSLQINGSLGALEKGCAKQVVNRYILAHPDSEQNLSAFKCLVRGVASYGERKLGCGSKGIVVLNKTGKGEGIVPNVLGDHTRVEDLGGEKPKK